MANMNTSQTEDLPVIKNSEQAQLAVQMSTFVYNSDLPPPYSVVDVAPTPVTQEIVQSPQPVMNQMVVQQTNLIPEVLKKTPVYVNCPNCHQRTITSVQYVNTQNTHMLAGFICGLTFWCMLCCLSAIPYIIPMCKNADHYCSHCNYFIGTYS